MIDTENGVARYDPKYSPALYAPLHTIPISIFSKFFIAKIPVPAMRYFLP